MAEKPKDDVVRQSAGLESLNWMSLPEIVTFEVDGVLCKVLVDGGGCKSPGEY